MIDEKEKVLLKSRKVTREQKERIKQNEFILVDNPNRCFKNIGNLKTLFEQRKSCRDLTNNLQINEIMEIINEIRNDKNYRPTPFAGNVDCISMCLYNYPEQKAFYVPVDFNQKIIFLNDLNDLSLFEENIERNEYSNKEGIYLFFLISFEKIKYKYLDMAEPLIYTTLGCLIQNITLSFCQNGIQSCIHYGIRKQIEKEIDGWNYFCPCFMKVGKKIV